MKNYRLNYLPGTVQTVNEPAQFKKLGFIDVASLKPGISGFIRARNEEQFIAAAIDSALPSLDQLIIVYNNCQDRTGEIVADYAARYPDKIKAFHYVPEVYPPCSQLHADTPAESTHSLCNYYNFSIAQIDYQIALKVDVDQIYDTDVLMKYREEVLTLNKLILKHDPSYNFLFRIAGTQPVYHKGVESLLTGLEFHNYKFDAGYFRLTDESWFVKHKLYEHLQINKNNSFIYAFDCKNPISFYHMRYIKNDFGIDNTSKEILFKYRYNITSRPMYPTATVQYHTNLNIKYQPSDWMTDPNFDFREGFIKRFYEILVPSGNADEIDNIEAEYQKYIKSFDDKYVKSIKLIDNDIITFSHNLARRRLRYRLQSFFGKKLEPHKKVQKNLPNNICIHYG